MASPRQSMEATQRQPEQFGNNVSRDLGSNVSSELVITTGKLDSGITEGGTGPPDSPTDNSVPPLSQRCQTIGAFL